jgi:glutamate-1-semialdehyde aminotransferase
MERIKSWEIISNKGEQMQKGWEQLANSHSLSISISGIPSLTTYTFNSPNNLLYKTFITQEMLKKGFLASTNFYASIAHEDDDFSNYFDALNQIYELIYKHENEKIDLEKFLEGPICHSGFSRLN